MRESSKPRLGRQCARPLRGRLSVFGPVAALLLSLGALLAPSASSAQTTSRDRQARALFDQGYELFQDAQYEQALEAFRSAYGLSHRPQLLYNIGLSEDRLRHDQLALVAFQGFLDQTGPEEPRRVEVERRVAVIQASIEEHDQLERQTAEATRAVAEASATAEASRHALELEQRNRPDDTRDTPQHRPLRRQWWLWTTVGVVLVAAVAVPLAVSHSGTETSYRSGSVGGVTLLLWGAR